MFIFGAMAREQMQEDRQVISIDALLAAAEEARRRKDRVRAIALIEAVFALIDSQPDLDPAPAAAPEPVAAASSSDAPEIEQRAREPSG